MAGSLNETKITTRGARAALSAGLHWRQLDADIHLGYRKGIRGGHWLVRWYVGKGNYKRAQIGVADDIMVEGTLSFEQANKKAREHVAAIRAREARRAKNFSETVRSTVNTYTAMRDARIADLHPGGRRRSDAASRLGRHVLSDELADTKLIELTEDALVKWKAGFAPDCTASSRARTITDLKAALNLAYRTFRKRLPADFGETIRWGLAIDKTLKGKKSRARENQILADDTIRDIVAAAANFDEDGDVGRMVLVLAATGARFSQVQRIMVGDVQPERRRIFVPASRKGQDREDGHYAVQVSQDVIDALRPALYGRSAEEPLLCRWRLKQAKGMIWVRSRRGAWTSAAEMTRQWKEICEGLRLTGVVPYALRHSSIVRAIRSGLPIRLVAAMHDTSVAMIERHYARFIVDGLEELAARAVIPLVKPRLSLVS